MGCFSLRIPNRDFQRLFFHLRVLQVDRVSQDMKGNQITTVQGITSQEGLPATFLSPQSCASGQGIPGHERDPISDTSIWPAGLEPFMETLSVVTTLDTVAMEASEGWAKCTAAIISHPSIQWSLQKMSESLRVA
ncbi:hypothetical protein mRhiFer1_007968 [Rhinolophus ferrumequinum]|uniref:Uncharacterized protein n=1 Tax=Rhinolophus ferrumequinum TaxID=59479 RepID=A0A7J8AVI4_RHIFE|nr:hypothetical protein mRhiFer1_007968 [Rhinolophus ferrumequinum]